MDQTKKLMRDFVAAFEEVFDKDWEFTKEMLDIRDQTPQENADGKALGLESIPAISKNGTFINPKVQDETEDWGHRGRLLRLYRELKKAL